MSSGGEGGERNTAARGRQDRAGAPRGPAASSRPPQGPAPRRSPARPVDPALEQDLDLIARLREAGDDLPGPDAAASARMRSFLMSTITQGDAETTALPRSTPGPADGRGVGRADRSDHAEHAEHADGTDVPLRTASDAGSTRSLDRTTRSTTPGGSRRAGSRSGARADARPADGRPTDRSGATRPGRRTTGRAHRLLARSTAAMCVVLALGALSVVLSRGALPGDVLYGLKRASETTELGLTSGQEAKGQKHLEFAALRLDEVHDLIGQDTAMAAGTRPAAAGLDPAQAALVTENLRDFEEQARQGAQLVLPLASSPSGPSPSVLADWAREQSTLLDEVAPSLDEGSRTQLAGSRALLDRLSTRAAALEQRRVCPEATSGSDELGPLPSNGECPGLRATAPAPGPTPTTEPTTSASTSKATSTSSRSSSTTTSAAGGGAATRSAESGPDSGSGSGSSDGGSLLPQVSGGDAPQVNVPAPVPGLPQVQLPPLLPGLPGISLG